VSVSRLSIVTTFVALVVCAPLASWAMTSVARPSVPNGVNPGAGSTRPVTAETPRVALRDYGRVNASTPIRLAVVFNYRHDNELQSFVALQGEPYARLPHAVLTADQFRNYFSPTVQDYARTIAILQRNGFSIMRTYSNRTVVDVSAPAAVVERTFATQLHRVAQPDGSLHYANVRPALMPEELKGLVFGVIGFDDLQVLKTTNMRYTGPRPATALGPPLQGPDLGLGPLAFASAYDLPVQHVVRGGKAGQTYDGLGQATAVVIDADFLDSDLQTFLNYFHIKRSGPPTVRLAINGGPPPGLTGDSGETTLDVETIVGNAPGVALYVYEMDSLKFTSTIDAYNQIVADNLVGAVNSSFGGCEDQTTPANFPAIANHIAMQGNALGIVFAASTGDNGTFECSINFGQPGGVSAPASGPSFVAVGGTTLFIHPTGAYSVEIGWGGSGGGVSDIFAMPAYQVGIPNMIGHTRNLPDVAFDASPGSGAAFFINNGWFGPIGGTSLAAPIFVALASELAQYDHARLGNIHPALYRAFKTYHYNLPQGAPLFHDVRGSDNGFYRAVAGYDQVTGIGSIDGWNFAVTTHL
jgi:subtilase family serine protease